MTGQQQRFVEAILAGRNPTAAARIAGYAKESAKQEGYRLMRHPAIRAALEGKQNPRNAEVAEGQQRARKGEVAFRPVLSFADSVHVRVEPPVPFFDVAAHEEVPARRAPVQAGGEPIDRTPPIFGFGQPEGRPGSPPNIIIED